MNGFNVKIAEASRELTPREKVMFKDTTNATQIALEASGNVKLVISPVGYVVLDVHNENGKDKDYKNYVIFDMDGNKFVTGSESFWEAFKNIWDEMLVADEAYQIECYSIPSKNFTGKEFLTCSLI